MAIPAFLLTAQGDFSVVILFYCLTKGVLRKVFKEEPLRTITEKITVRLECCTFGAKEPD